MRTIQEIQQKFPGVLNGGLTESEVDKSRSEFGSNQLTPLPREPLWKKFIGMFDDPIIKILLAAALLSMLVDLYNKKEQLTAGISLAVFVVAIIAALVMKWGRWLPTMLFVSAILLFFVGLITGHALVEGLAVMVAVILATGVAFLSEYKSDREFEILNSQKDALRVKVTRDGEFHTVLMEEVVVGDVVMLEMGDEIPADGRLRKATELYVDQSLMTGESEPVRKQARPADDTADGPEQPGCIYRGTQIVDGVGELVVGSVGDETYLGQIAKRLSADDDDDDDEGDEETPENEEKRVKHKLTVSKELTPLQLKLTVLAEQISLFGYIAAGAIFIVLMISGMFFTTPAEVYWPSNFDQFSVVIGNILQYFVYIVIIIVVAVPEGLPMSVTVSLALAMRKMTRANSLVRQLVACETIGSATVICSDKTGTLTQNKMQVVRTFWDGTTLDRDKPEWALPDKDAAWPRDGKPIDWIVLNSTANSTANLEEKEGVVLTVGNSTEGALLQWVQESGLNYKNLRKELTPKYQLHFSSDRKRMTTVVRYGDKLVTLVKGAPEWVLDHSTHYQSADGTAKEWTDETRDAVREALRDSASQAMRTLAFGYAELPPDTPEEEDALHERRESLESNLVFVGFIAIRDPLRSDVKEAVEQSRTAGIEAKMITGDNVETARAIAYDIALIDSRDAEIDTESARILTSPEFNKRFDEMRELEKVSSPSAEQTQRADLLREQLRDLRVLARARPLDKYKMVELLQQRNDVVAVTGDGTNDAPALKKADVGLAMGIAGTEVAKEASKIVLLDDAFSTIVKAVHWGRSLYENIQRFLQFQLTINVSALVIAFLGPFFGIKPPFTVLQLLWINVIMDTFAAIALCSEPPRPGLMVLPPKKKDENIVTWGMMKNILITGSFFVVVMITLLLGMKHYHWFAEGSGANPEGWEFAPLNIRQVTIFFTIYVFFQVWNSINCRSLVPETSGFSGIFNNPVFLGIVGTIAVVQIAIVYVPGLNTIFKVEPLGVLDWVYILVGTASVLIFAEISRRVQLAQRTPADTPPQAA